ncbi:OmpA family protein [Fonticella tunisiensis]|uniref:Chemotaxis protein MotB n=1 Tax=Fonticella tunisiensis TaxID=1096341 RepID=A0A4R7KD21_9CLOT|nr:OmpA family protein [Fonticella tunisiensis]TDT50602.1 chemotaxis protein MotB [Fonticella tunisiensis]
MSRRGRKRSESGGGEWLTTYADLMTLLLTFFVLLYAFSSIDAVKFKQIALSLSRALGGNSGIITDGGNIGPIPVNENPGEKKKDAGNAKIEQIDEETKKIYGDVISYIKENNLDTKVSVKEDIRGVIIELQEKILFDSGKADIKPESRLVLDKISDLLVKFPNEIMVEGHTDNVKMNKGFYQSNWELSMDRAVKVVRYLTEVKELDPTKFYAVGAGEYRPIADNSTPEGRQKNRRVNILIVSSKKESNQ